MANKTSYEEVYNMIKEKGYLLISKVYINNNSSLDVKDDDNYIYQVRLSDIKANKRPRKFSNKNKYTIENIKNYLKINNIKLELLSTNYTSSGDKMQFKTKEKYLVEINTENLQMGKYPTEFSIRNSNLEYNIKLLLSRQISFRKMKFIKYNFIKNYIYVEMHDIEGYKYETSIESIKKNILPQKINLNNKFTLYNINNYIIINKIKVKLLSEEYVNSNSNLLFKCNCGRTFERRWSVFAQGVCTCEVCSKSTSSNELIIENLLIKRKVSYIKQYTFNDCLSNNKNKLKFDFGIIDNENNLVCLIETDGLQHMKPIELWGGSSSFGGIVYNDAIKNSYCEDNSIKLLRIHYYELNKAELLTNEFIDSLDNNDIYNNKDLHILNFKNDLDDNILNIYKMKHIFNMSQADICRKTGLSSASVSRIITFKRNYIKYKEYIENNLIYTPTTTNREMCYL